MGFRGLGVADSGNSRKWDDRLPRTRAINAFAFGPCVVDASGLRAQDHPSCAPKQETKRQLEPYLPDPQTYTHPKGPRTQINGVLGPKYYNLNGIWALKPYNLGPWSLKPRLDRLQPSVISQWLLFCHMSQNLHSLKGGI